MFRFHVCIRPLVLCTALTVCAVRAHASESTTLSGYGELHLNAVYPDTGLRASPQLDFHRFVLIFGHQFNDRWSMAAELELEHNYVEGNKRSGYLILEQAYLQWLAHRYAELRAGILLQPMGLVNERHEPNLFSSVERPEYHRVIIPTTWFGAGAAIGGTVADNRVRYDFLLTEGLDDRKYGAKDQGIREARQKGFYSSLETILLTLRVDYVGVPGLLVGSSVALNQLTADRDTMPRTDNTGAVVGPNPNRHVYNRALIGELHAAYTARGFRTSIEFAHIDYTPIEGRGGTLSSTQGLTAEFGYDVARVWNAKELAMYPFIRYSRLNTSGTIAQTNAYTRIDAGLAIHPIRKLAVKIDAGREYYADPARNKSVLSGGVGYAF